MVSAGAPLGVFDSGLGGLTVVRALRRSLPGEHIVYLGDTARVPYGTRSAETILRYARSCAAELTQRGVKALVIACNTVSAVAVERLRAELDLPVMGVIVPGATAVVRVAEQHGAQRVGVLGTLGTIASNAYPRAVAQLSTRIEVIGQAAPLLVPLVEEGWLEGGVPRLAVRRYLEPLVAAGVGALVLGCTHYPLLHGLIAEVATELRGAPLPVVDSAEATVTLVEAWMREGIIGQRAGGALGRLELLVTDRPTSFAEQAGRFLTEPLPEVELIELRP